MQDFSIRPITSADNAAVAQLIRTNLEQHGLALPGTVYDDPEVFCLSKFYQESAARAYFVLDWCGEVLGGAGFGELAGEPGICELQKLYLHDKVKGKGLGRRLLEYVEKQAQVAGYTKIYLETHDALAAAMRLYAAAGYREIPAQLGATGHSTMNHFFLKEL